MDYKQLLPADWTPYFQLINSINHVWRLANFLKLFLEYLCSAFMERNFLLMVEHRLLLVFFFILNCLFPLFNLEIKFLKFCPQAFRWLKYYFNREICVGKHRKKYYVTGCLIIIAISAVAFFQVLKFFAVLGLNKQIHIYMSSVVVKSNTGLKNTVFLTDTNYL